MKKKILVCGSAGFLMSNFIRYLLYRSKDYKVIGVDKLCNPDVFKKMYIHKDHTFYMGDVADENFIYKIMTMEKPDIIINGVDYSKKIDGPDTIVKGAFFLSLYSSVPIIQLTPSIWEMDPNGWWNAAAMTVNEKGTILELPNCFGFRQKKNDGVARMIWEAKYKEKVEVYPHPVPWVYAEDVASMVWFLMEELLEGKTIPHIKMPASHYVSSEKIVKIIKEEFGLPNVETTSNFSRPICKSHQADKVEGWASDFDFDDTLLKTIRWYKCNPWSLCII